MQQLECLELAGCTLERYISEDNSHPSFLEITGMAAQENQTRSGLNPGDYRNLASLLNHPNLSLLKILNIVPFPPQIMEHLSYMQSHCLMGVFPEISRVWVVIDSTINIWAFEHGGDVAYLDGFGENIVSVGLVQPKAGVFESRVKYLLVLTTPVEISVLGVTSSSTTQDGTAKLEEIHVNREPIFVLPTDGVSMLCVKGTAKGRIFMGGKDGCLCEVTYQAQLGCFEKQCKKVNHSTSILSFLLPSFIHAAFFDEDAILKIEVDYSRNILYTLSEKGCIQVFDLGSDGTGLRKVAEMNQRRIVSSSVDIVKTLEPDNFKPVIAISAVEESESAHFNLVAVTQTGTRLYFSVGTGDAAQGGSQRPKYLALLHVRLPPGLTPYTSVLKPTEVHNAVYNNGTFVMVCLSSEEEESLWCLSKGLSAAGFSEIHTDLKLNEPSWSLSPLPPTHSDFLSPALLAKREVWSSSRWALVNDGGVAVLATGSAADVLRALLRDYRGPDAQPVKDMFQLHGVEQACACALYLACEDTSDMTVSEWAARAFFRYGSLGNMVLPSPLHQQNSPVPKTYPSVFAPRLASTPVSMRPQERLRIIQMNQSYQDQLMDESIDTKDQSMMLSYQQNMSSPIVFNKSSFIVTQRSRDSFIHIEFSAKHNGLYIYTSRILSPIWNLKCVTKSMTPENKEFMSSNVTGEDCAYIAKSLQRVLTFMQLVSAPPLSDEQASLNALKTLIVMAIEMLSLWKVLCEHQFHLIADRLPAEQQMALQAASFRELLVGRKEMACLLLGSLLASYIKDNASVDDITHKLRQLCPTLYSHEDASYSKANELLMFAEQQNNPEERCEMLRQALKLCKDVAPDVNLPQICSKLVSVGFYTGVVELCEACAKNIDPLDNAVYYYKRDQPSLDREGHCAYYRRMEVYREVCCALERLYERSEGTWNANCQGLLWDCLCRDDELLHVAVYDWLLSKNLGSELLSLPGAPPLSLCTYISAAARSAPAPAALCLLDLLWKVLEKAGDHLSAANVLQGLATKPGTGASLSQRMAWLSAAVVCLRGAGVLAESGSELLRRLEKAADVARVQAAVRAAMISVHHTAVPPHLLHRLDDELLEITQLYEEYAHRYNLWWCKLALLKCSGDNKALVVEDIWSNILAEVEAAARYLPTPDDRLASILSKVTTLGREYVNTRYCFPLYLIVRQLEITNCRLQADKSMVFKAILSIGVSLEKVLDIYIDFVSVSENAWLECGDESHVCACAVLLLNAASAHLMLLPLTKRRRALTRCMELHDAALFVLQNCLKIQRLMDMLTVAQEHLNRLDRYI